MKPVEFEYCRPSTLPEALALLEEFGSEASVLAGGMSLGAMLNMRLVRPHRRARHQAGGRARCGDHRRRSTQPARR